MLIEFFRKIAYRIEQKGAAMRTPREDNNSNSFSRGHIRLATAVLAQAVYDLYNSSSAKIKNEAEHYIFSSREDPFSFNWLCRAVGRDPQRSKKQLEISRQLAIKLPRKYERHVKAVEDPLSDEE